MRLPAVKWPQDEAPLRNITDLTSTADNKYECQN